MQKQFIKNKKGINFKGLEKDLKNNYYFGEKNAYLIFSIFFTACISIFILVVQFLTNIYIRQLTLLETILPQPILFCCLVVNVYLYEQIKFRKFSKNIDEFNILVKHFENREDNEFNKKVLMVLNSKYKFLHFPTIVYLTGQICQIKLPIETILENNNISTIEDIDEAIKYLQNNSFTKIGLLFYCLLVLLDFIFIKKLKVKILTTLEHICKKHNIITKRVHCDNIINDLKRIKELKQIRELIIQK